MGRFGCRDHFFVRGIRFPHNDILPYGSGLQPGFLQHHTVAFPQTLPRDFPDIMPAHADSALVHIIVDEATSSIDTRTEIKIQQAFATMMKGRTSFIVAHRLSTIKEADVILVMKDGNIIEQGNHETLLAMGGFYANLYQSQFAKV